MNKRTNLNRLTILIADDQEIVLRGLKGLLNDFWPGAVVRQAKTVAELIIEVRKKPTVIITEVTLPEAYGVKLMKQILDAQVGAKVLVFSTLNESIYAMPYLKHGAAGYLLKNAPEGEIIAALTTVLAGSRYSSKNIKESMFNSAFGTVEKVPFAKLSARELEVAELLVKGDGVLDISKKLNLQMGTVSTYKLRLFQKLKVKNIIELAETIAVYQR
ncbi:two-component system invasion response regulator UvrY [Pedobacter sp. UYP30]|uniref:response regulator transcription factor n=1 Tax=Pedobacter sp. UYP30 TaxID=1756400 RepID=UPI00339574EB